MAERTEGWALAVTLEHRKKPDDSVSFLASGFPDAVEARRQGDNKTFVAVLVAGHFIRRKLGSPDAYRVASVEAVPFRKGR